MTAIEIEILGGTLGDSLRVYVKIDGRYLVSPVRNMTRIFRSVAEAERAARKARKGG